MQHPVLAIDHGDARIGLAATDPLGIAAHPVETIEVARHDPIERIAQIVRERGVVRLLLGLPLRLDGSEGSSAAKVRAFGRELAERIPGVPLEFTDERLSTMAASEKLRSAGRPARRQREIIDQAAALEILNDCPHSGRRAISCLKRGNFGARYPLWILAAPPRSHIIEVT